MIPTYRTVCVAALLFFFAVAVAYLDLPAVYWDGAVGICLGLVAFDALLGVSRSTPKLTREIPHEVSQGKWVDIGLFVENRTRRAVALKVFDHFPSDGEHTELPVEVYVPPERGILSRYRWLPTERGDAHFGVIQARIDSPLKFWQRNLQVDAATSVKVFPAMIGFRQAALNTRQQARSQVGESRRRHRGDGSEFLQLRDYEPGDQVSRIDWRATSRTRKLVSREYLDEREQRIIFLLDCGRRMRSRDGLYSHFDQALSALLKLAFVASRHSDAVGALAFGVDSEISRNVWIAPRRGRSAVRAILNGFYAVQPGLGMPDFEQAITQILHTEKRQALIVLISNVRDEDGESLVESLTSLGKRHRVLLANLRENVVGQLQQNILSEAGAVDGRGTQSADDSSLLLGSVARHYDNQRQRLLKVLRSRGVWVIDVEPNELSARLINSYLAIKAGARSSEMASSARFRRSPGVLPEAALSGSNKAE